MRVVLDTNVIVSALLTPHGPPARILDWTLAGELTVLLDDRLLDEYRVVLARTKFGFDPRDLRILLAALDALAERVVALPLSVELPDPDDLPFLEVASSGRADALITGNRRHFRPRRGHPGVEILAPAEALASMRRI
ncbi:MAG: putative toxin-antitoxin system toxin component, PIN family [Gammaproteobacteria bacterium]|nr:MAG: putative toxin-antitoxin system toxin component, PIN family [Gammaproteobacteria bacterium]